MSFTPDVYQTIRDGCLRSARTVVPVVVDLIKPRTVIDFGCGEGWWLSVFAEHGCTVTGVDDGHGELAIPTDRFHRVDMASAVTIDLGRYDLAVSLEVAEHLPASRANWFIDTICAHADTVLFSAAIPAQGGTNHVNEQWPAFWVEKFEARGYRVSGGLRWQFWNAVPDGVESWYAQNLLLCMKDPGPLDNLFEGPANAPIAVVHPRFWQARLGV